MRTRPLLDRVRIFCARPRVPRRFFSAPTVDQRLAEIIRRLRHMEPSSEAQAIIDQINQLPAAISAQVDSEVTAAEAAKDAQRAADIDAIGAALTTVKNGIGTPAPAAAPAPADPAPTTLSPSGDAPAPAFPV